MQQFGRWFAYNTAWRKLGTEDMFHTTLLLFSCQVVSDSCDPMDWSPPGSFVHGISQARILEWVALLFSRGIFSTQRLNPHLLHWRQSPALQEDSWPLSHQGSPITLLLIVYSSWLNKTCISVTSQAPWAHKLCTNAIFFQCLKICVLYWLNWCFLFF